MVMTFYPHLPNNYEDFEDNCDPVHQSMRIICKGRKRPKRVSISGFSYDPKAIDWIRITLNKSVGKKFNDVYSKVCSKFNNDKSIPFREEFRSWIDFRYIPGYRYNSYYLDDEGVIREYPSRTSSNQKIVKIPISESSIYYKINYSNFFKYPKILDRIRITFGNKLYYKIFTDGKVSQSLGDKIGNIVCFSLRREYNLYLDLDDFIIRTKDVKYIEYVKGSKEFTKYYSEYFQALRKRDRESKKKLDIELSTLLQRIEYKRKLEALKLNEITRDRLGFCKDSFTGEFYHGQKRKKRKNG